MIYIQPHSGLANRIRVIISGLHFSEKKSEKMIILWSKDESLFCNFKDIYELNDKFKVVHISFFVRILGFLLRKKISRKAFFYFFQIRNYITDFDIPIFVWSTGTNNIDIEKLSNKPGNDYFLTCHEFYFDRIFFKFLKPTLEIRNSINNITSLFKNNTVGIHIRRTDHLVSIEHSPIELFIKAIQNEILKDSSIQFFLATDDIATEILLNQIFGNKILTNKKEFRRKSENGIKGAMIDLYSLAATNKIYGSFYSSFSDIASRIGDIPLEIIKA